MLFVWANSSKKGIKMAANTCKIIMARGNQSATTKGVSCTSDVELHIFLLTCAR